jgi:hypothetical protein
VSGVVQFFTPENRLRKALTAVGGKHIVDAIAEAEVELLQVADACRAEVDRGLARTYALTAEIPTGETLNELYRTVREVAGLAAICDLADLGAAALSFCALLDHAREGGQLTMRHLQVYTNVLRVLRNPELFSEADRTVVLSSLDTVVKKFAGKAAATG